MPVNAARVNSIELELFALTGDEIAAYSMPRSVTLDGATFHMKTESEVESKVPLSRFIRVELVKGLYLLYIAKDAAVALPQRAFKSEQDQIDVIHMLAAAHVPIVINPAMRPIAVAPPTLPIEPPPSQD